MALAPKNRPPAQPEDRMTDAELVQRSWRGHRERSFVVGGFVPPGGGNGVVVIDAVPSPPIFWVFSLDNKEGLKAVRGDFIADEDARLPAAVIAQRALAPGSGARPIPLHEAMRLLGLGGEGLEGSLASASVRRFSAALGDPRLSAKLPITGLVQSEMKRLDSAGLEQVKAAFDPAALAALSAVDAFKWRDVSYYAEQGELGEVRREAARLFPLFATMFVDRISLRRKIDAQAEEKRSHPARFAARMAEPVERDGVTRTRAEWAALDGRDIACPPWTMSEKAIRQFVAEAFGKSDDGKPKVEMHVLSNLRGVTWPTGGVPLDRIIAALSQLPADWFPKDQAATKDGPATTARENWDAFCDLTDTIGRLLPGMSGQVDANGKSVPIPLKTLYEGCGGKWAELRERIVRAHAETRPPEGAEDQDLEYLERIVDWSALKALPKAKVPAAARASVDAMVDLRAEIRLDAVAEWIVNRVAPDESRAVMSHCCIEVEEMIDSYSRKVVVPLAANEATRRCGRREHILAHRHHVAAQAVAARTLLPGKSAVRLMETVRIFINRITELESAGLDVDPDRAEIKRAEEAERQRKTAEIAAKARLMASVGIDPNAPITADGWAPVSPIVQAPNGVFVVPLTDAGLLADEGRGWGGASEMNADGSRGLKICVGTMSIYAKRCRGDGEHILSFRRTPGPNGQPFERLATLELAPIVQGSAELGNRQFYGRGNGAVPEEAQRAWDWYQQQVRAGVVPLNYDGVRLQMAAARAANVDEVAMLCGFDWRDRSRIAQAMAAWAPFVGKKQRKLGVDEYAVDPDILEVVQEIDPQLQPPQAPAPRM
jgi:hypothetical protein